MPEPAKPSSTRSPRREQSRIASATIRTGFTVGCIASASSRSVPKLFTPAERVFYEQLAEAVGDRYEIFGKVRLAGVIEPREGLDKSERQGALNRITSKHLDFVLAIPGSMIIVCAIELDDASHRRQDRVDRDEFVDGALAYADVPLIRFEVQPMYSIEEIRDSVADALSDTRELKEPRLFL